MYVTDESTAPWLRDDILLDVQDIWPPDFWALEKMWTLIRMPDTEESSRCMRDAVPWPVPDPGLELWVSVVWLLFVPFVCHLQV